MSSQPTSTKSTSRWGSFLQQAVAGVESRLDTILADDDSGATKPKETTDYGKRKDVSTLPAASRSSTDISRQSSTSKKNDRLQERLAKAVVARNSARSNTSSTFPSRTPSPSKQPESQRTSLDSRVEVVISAPSDNVSEAEVANVETAGRKSVDSEPSSLKDELSSTTAEHAPSIEDPPLPDSSSINSHGSRSERPSLDSARDVANGIQTMASHEKLDEISPAVVLQYQESINQMRSDYEAAELRRQEETHGYTERIDALQAKLQYLTREAAEIARKGAAIAKPGSTEQKLAEKEEKIALLMEEGQSLSQTELKHMNTIRKLRAKSAEDEKRINLTKKTADELEKSMKAAQERAKRAEAAHREASDRAKTLQRVERELEKAKADNSSRASQITNLLSQLNQEMNAKGNGKEINEALEAERALTADLRDDLSNAKIEKELSDERHRAQIREMQEQFGREREKTKISELELRGELAVLESRLETFRTRAEEVASGRSGDTQVKLLRQVETLQTQYSEASENWRGIEGSLLARIAGLERDRDDITKKETDSRRRMRELNAKSRRLEDQLEQATTRIQDMESELAGKISKVASLQESLAKAEAEITKTQKTLEIERESWQARMEERVEAERRELDLQLTEIPFSHVRTESPAMSSRKKSPVDRASPHGRRNQAGSALGLTGTSTPFTDRPVSRRSSTQPSQALGYQGSYRDISLSSTLQQSGHNGVPETPSINTEQQEDFFDGVITPATPDRTINDMFSVSTAAAGPSLQLVERMSAAVRRLESEKAASKDEFDRLTAQRDEARDQVVALMREAEEKRKVDIKLVNLEKEVSEINQRYQTTLEMLGEKSERVEELQADIADVKQMYRDLVESTMK